MKPLGKQLGPNNTTGVGSPYYACYQADIQKGDLVEYVSSSCTELAIILFCGAGLFSVINFIDREHLFCNSKDLRFSVLDPTVFCIIAGMRSNE